MPKQTCLIFEYPMKDLSVYECKNKVIVPFIRKKSETIIKFSVDIRIKDIYRLWWRIRNIEKNSKRKKSIFHTQNYIV